MKLSDFFGKRPKESPALAQLNATRQAMERASDPRTRDALEKDLRELSEEVAYDELTQTDDQGAAISEARDELRKIGDMIAGRGEPLIGVQVLIERAIHHGAPIYNLGSHIGCALIYQLTGRLILRTLEGLPGRQGGVAAIRERFALAAALPITPLTANKRAWELRHAFDATLAEVSGTESPAPAEPPKPAAAPGGRRPVFVSHASPDKATAEQLVRYIEAAGVPCWIAPRDVRIGSNYSGEIVDAIKGADVALVLLSAQANASSFVPSEIERAANYNKKIVAVRLEEVAPSRNLELFLGARHWIDLFDGDPRREENLRRLIDMLREHAEFAGAGR